MTINGIFMLGSYTLNKKKEKKFVPSFKWNLTSYEMITGRNDDERHPTTQPKVDYIEVKLVSKDILRPIAEWYLSDTMQLGLIIVEIVPMIYNKSFLRKIEFVDARCYSYVEEFQTDTNLRTATIRIVPGSITVDGVKFKN